MNLKDALNYMPHKGAMLLIEEILEADEGSITCRATDHTEPAYSLRIAGQLAAISLIELGAQASAAHASLYEFGGHHDGLLLGLSSVNIWQTNPELFNTPLTVQARRLNFDGGTARYWFAVCGRTDEYLSGEAMFLMEGTRV